MGIDVGFDFWPILSDSDNDIRRWINFLNDVTYIYKDDPNFNRDGATIKFRVGEHPTLPENGRIFRRFSSKITGSCGSVEPYISRVSHIAKQHFPNQVHPWHEALDEYGVYTWSEVDAALGKEVVLTHKLPDETQDKGHVQDEAASLCSSYLCANSVCRNQGKLHCSKCRLVGVSYSLS